MKYINFLLVLITLSCSNTKTKSNHKNIPEQNIDTISYHYSGFNNGLKLDLLSDGTFVNEKYLFGCTGGGERKKVFGTYKFDSVKLILIPQKVEFIQYPMDMESEPTTTKVTYGIDSLTIKTEYQIVTWGNKKYLLSDFYDSVWSSEKENDYIRFADYSNSGFEPKTSGRYLVKGTEDSITSEFDLGQIPEKWQKYFLKEPITAKIKSIRKVIDQEDHENFWWQIELNKGEDHGVYSRLTMTTKDDMFFIDIDSVLKNSSYGKYYMPDFTPDKYPIGT